MPKTRPLATRLRAARRLLAEERRIVFDSHAINGKLYHQPTIKTIARFDDALQALAEAIKREAGRAVPERL